MFLKYQRLVSAASPKPITQCPASNLGVGRRSGLERKIRMEKGRKGSVNLDRFMGLEREDAHGHLAETKPRLSLACQL